MRHRPTETVLTPAGDNPVNISPFTLIVPEHTAFTAAHFLPLFPRFAQHNACVEHELRSDNQSSTGGRREAFGNLLLYWPNFTSGLVVYTFTPVTFSLLPNLAWVQ
ncbi:hypothetical protein J6590_023594 [Homalodisca vitripennis]|nr:hypothetical protein J6590_023594 [Homalodisca vitripennis]